MGMFDSTRDNVLDNMTTEWGITSGDVESPSGWFARLTIEQCDMRNAIAQFGSYAFSLDVGFDFGSLIGYWIITVDSNGMLNVFDMPDEETMMREYDALDTAYGNWLFDDDENAVSLFDNL